MAPSSVQSSNTATSQVGIVRCNVVLPNGKSVRVPISEDALLAELHQAAILRGSATSLDFSYTVEATALKLGGQDAAYLWDQDKISDVVDNAENHTFHLTALVRGASPPTQVHSQQQAEHTGPPRSQSDVMSFEWDASNIVNTRLRWVLPETAMIASKAIDSLPTERDALPLTTTLAELHHMAVQKLTSLQSTTGPLLPDVSPTMYTAQSHLANPRAKDNSVASLGLVTSTAAPLTIFLVPTRASGTDPRDALSFKTSDRAWATFITSLRLFKSKIAQDTLKLENFLEVLWELTHFPPAIISLRQMVLDKEIQPQPCAVFATCFKEVCLQVVPFKQYGSDDDVLLTSRQVFSWLSSLRSHSSTILQASHPIVHAVEIRKPATQSRLSTIGNLTHEETIQISGRTSSSEANSQQSGPIAQQLVVCKEKLDDVCSEMLALALDEGKDSIIRYYFDLPDTFGSSFGRHKRRKMMDPKEFVDLLRTIHQDDIFRMIGPFQLSQCAGVALPVITLDAAGYVSLFDRKDLECDQKYIYTWNIIKGEQRLPASEPGHHLFQNLEPLITERKKAGTWQLDAWEDARPGTFGGPPYEAIVVCVDTSASMTSSMPEMWFENYDAANSGEEELSRINEVKEFFKNFMVRLNAYRVSTDIALVTFAERGNVKTHQPLTRVVLELQNALDRVQTGSRTALWDGIRRSCEMLVEHKTKHSDVKLRIITLTDGINNDSQAMPADVCAELYKHNIVLDAIVIDTNETTDLFKIAKHTGGYALHPQNRTALFQIFLLENFIDIRTRPDIVKVPIHDYSSTVPKFADLKTMFDLPPCRPHENQNDHFIALADAALFLRRGTRSVLNPSTSRGARSVSIEPASPGFGLSVSSESPRSVASGSTRILLDQVQNAISNQHDFIDIYVSESNMSFWKVVMQGRPGTPYESGTFLAYLEIGNDYPSKPPSMRFITPILHPNVSKHGRICHHIFDRSWDADFSIMQVIQHIWDILVLVESADAIDPISALRFYTDQESAERLIKAYITRFALKSRDTHRKDICGVESAVPTIHSGRTDSVVSLSSASSSSWQSIGSQQIPPRPSSRLTTSALGRQQAMLRDALTYCNPSHLGRTGSNRSLTPSQRPRSTTQTPSVGGTGALSPRIRSSTIRDVMTSPLSREPQTSGNAGNASDPNISNTVAHPAGNPFAAQGNTSGSAPPASTTTLPVSRRASFFRQFKKPSSRS